MDTNYVEKVQKYSLEILEFIDKICKKYDIKYSLDCGTLIGAVREKGFIPWDDDADIAFTRIEYERFISILDKEEIPSYIKIYKPENTSHFLDFNIRLYNTKEIVRNDEYAKNHFDGIWQYPIVDLYVYDNLPTATIAKRLYILKLQILFGLAMSKRYKIKYKNYKFFTRIYIFILSNIGRIFSIKKICNMYKKTAMSYKNSDLLYCTSWAPEYPGYQYHKSDFNDYIYTDFSGTKLQIFKNYDSIIKVYYGDDYMTPKKTHDHAEFIHNF